MLVMLRTLCVKCVGGNVLLPQAFDLPKYALVTQNASGAKRWFSGLYRKKGWAVWRRRLWQQRQRQGCRRRYIRTRSLLKESQLLSKPHDPSSSSQASQREQPKGNEWQFTVSQLKFSRKNLSLVKKLIQNLHIQDAIDWLCAIPRARLNPIYDDLVAARDRIALEYGGDPGRLYIKNVRVEQGTPVRYGRYALANVYTRYRSWRNRLHYSIVQLSLPEYFKRVYIKGKVPRSLAFDMRLALKEKRAPHFMLEEWQPYICSASRQLHRRRLLFKQRTKTLDLRQIQREWTAAYQRNILERENDLRRQRHLEPFSFEPIRNEKTKGPSVLKPFSRTRAELWKQKSRRLRTKV